MPPNSNKLPRVCSWERETDASFEVIHSPIQEKLTPTKLLQLTNYPPDAPVEIVSVGEFFDVANAEEDWHDEEERETVQRFQNLVNIRPLAELV